MLDLCVCGLLPSPFRDAAGLVLQHDTHFIKLLADGVGAREVFRDFSFFSLSDKCLNGVSLNVPVKAGKAALGTWQGIYLAEHRSAPHTREIVLQFIGSRT